MNTQKGFASILLILLATIFIGGGVYVYDQKNDLGIFETKENIEPLVVTEEKKEEKNNNPQINTEEIVDTQLKVSAGATTSVQDSQKTLTTNVVPTQTVNVDVYKNINTTTSLEIKDCKGDIYCFTNAVLTCEPTKATYTTKTGIEDMFIQTTTVYSELRPQTSSCQVYSKMIESKSEYLISVDQETLDTAEKVSQFQKGRDGVCTIVDKKLYAKTLNDLSEGSLSFSTADEGELANVDGQVYAKNCTGKLYTTEVISY